MCNYNCNASVFENNTKYYLICCCLIPENGISPDINQKTLRQNAIPCEIGDIIECPNCFERHQIVAELPHINAIHIR